jgi:hypothetical protein
MLVTTASVGYLDQLRQLPSQSQLLCSEGQSCQLVPLPAPTCASCITPLLPLPPATLSPPPPAPLLHHPPLTAPPPTPPTSCLMQEPSSLPPRGPVPPLDANTPTPPRVPPASPLAPPASTLPLHLLPHAGTIPTFLLGGPCLHMRQTPNAPPPSAPVCIQCLQQCALGDPCWCCDCHA